MDPVNIIYWNANGISNKIIEFFTFLIDNNIDIACVCETHLNLNQHIHSHPDYMIHRLDRTQNTWGGVMIVIKRGIQHEILPSQNFNLLECIGISLKTSNNSFIDIFSVYLPGGSSHSNVRIHYLNDLRKLTRRQNSYFVMGDFNSKHRFWNCLRANVPGQILYNEYCSSDFLILHPSSHTHYPSNANFNPSTIDLVLTNGLQRTSNLECLQMNSDHNPVKFQIFSNENLSKNYFKSIKNYKQADWEKYKMLINYELNINNLNINNIITTTQIDDMIERLTNIMLTAESRSIPIIKHSNLYFVELTPDIKEDIKIRNLLNKRWQRNRNPQLKTFINYLNKSISYRINNIRNMNWNHQLKNIPPDKNQLWKINKYLKNKNTFMPPFKINEKLIFTGQEKSEVLADKFSMAHNNPLKDENPIFSNSVDTKVEEYLTNITEVEGIIYPCEEEIKVNLKNIKTRKSPGLDGIQNCLIKQLPSNGLFFLNIIFMACLKLSYFPAKWKKAKVIAIPKSGKNSSDPGNYRPISLLSSLSKLFERIILNRINNHLSDHQILLEEQYGFRSKHSTTHQLKRITQHIKDQYISFKSSTGMILLDVEKAFDRVWHKGLIYKMIEFNFPQYIIKIVYSFLADREFEVYVNGQHSTSRPMPFGCPQGACLSPILYNIFTSDFPKSSECSLALFADDTSYFTSSPFAAVIISKLLRYSNQISAYFNKWKICINSEKTQAIFFTKRRTRELPASTINIFNSHVNFQNNVKYLGLILDKRLSFNNHIDHVIEKTNKKIKVLYSLINRNSKLNINNKLLLYKIVLRPTLTYACPIFNEIAKSHLKKLQIIQSKILKTMLNVPWFTSTEYIHNITEIPLILNHINTLSNNFINSYQ